MKDLVITLETKKDTDHPEVIINNIIIDECLETVE